MSEHNLLLNKLKQAQQNFDYADEGHKNKAIYDLMYAEEKLKQFREGRGTNDSMA